MTDRHQDDIDVIADQWQQTGLEADYAAMKVVARILRLNKTIEKKLAKLHASFNLKQGEFDVLAALKRCGEEPLTPSQLHQSMLLSSGAMTSRIDRLEKKLLVERKHCLQDRRSIKVELTAKGKDLINQVYRAHFKLLDTLLSNISINDKIQLADLLKITLHETDKVS